MTALLPYRPNHRWQIWAAFTSAVLLHLAAIAIAGSQPQDIGAPEIADPGIGVVIDPSTPDPALGHPVEAPPPPAPPVPKEISFPEESATPPPARIINHKQIHPVPSKAPSFAGSTTLRVAKVVALNAPPQEYPYEARRQRMVGSGVARLTIDMTAGRVTDVQMVRSTGSAVLDNATLSGLRRWRFKLGEGPVIDVPITFTLAGAAY